VSEDQLTKPRPSAPEKGGKRCGLKEHDGAFASDFTKKKRKKATCNIRSPRPLKKKTRSRQTGPSVANCSPKKKSNRKNPARKSSRIYREENRRRCCLSNTEGNRNIVGRKCSTRWKKGGIRRRGPKRRAAGRTIERLYRRSAQQGVAPWWG